MVVSVTMFIMWLVGHDRELGASRWVLPGLMVLILYIHFRLGRKQGPAQPA